MQKSIVVQVWVNDLSCKQITVTPTSTCEDIIKYLADQYNIPKRAMPHLELHVVHNGKDHSIVQREEKMMSHLQALAQAGLRIDETTHKNKLALLVNHDAVKKAQKLSGHAKSSSSWSPLSYFRKRSGAGHHRSASSPTVGGPEDPSSSSSKHSRGGSGSASNSSNSGLSSSTNALLKTRPQDPPASSSSSTILEDTEKMPSSTPNTAPHLAPRVSISPPRAGVRSRSKTLCPSLSSSDLRNQEALNQMITQRIKNRSSLNYERPPLADSHLQSDLSDSQNSPRRGSIGSVGNSSPRAGSPPPPQRLFEPPPTIHLSPSTSSSSISIASASLPATAPRQRSLTTSGVISNRFTPPRSQFAEMTIGSSGMPATAWKHDSSDSYLPPSSTSSSTSSLSSSSSSVSASTKADDEHLELLAVVELLKKASSYK